jgi:hypothetical protein
LITGKALVGEIEVKHLILPLKQGIPAAVRAATALEQEMKDHHNLLRHPDWVMVRLMVPAMRQGQPERLADGGSESPGTDGDRVGAVFRQQGPLSGQTDRTGA